ncbi:MAG: hypothetical protein ACW98D_11670 [Promethearchaeota archaeon]|jgi:hypothetical protein
MNKKHEQLVPNDMDLLGFEAIYEGDNSSTRLENDPEKPVFRTVDDLNNPVLKWSTWTFTFPGQEKYWNKEIKYINEMQKKLGPLNNKTRRIRAHIGSLVPCDSGFPITIDELLNAIGQGELAEPSFHNGCWCSGMWWDLKGTQSYHLKSMRIIYEVLKGYTAGIHKDKFLEEFSLAQGFINRTYEWLGSYTELSKLKRLLLERMLLPFEFYAKIPHASPEGWSENGFQLRNTVFQTCFGEDGRGSQLDAEISELTGLPQIPLRQYEKYLNAIKTISNSQQREIFEIWDSIANGIYQLSDCHHNTFRAIENQIYAIAKGKQGIPSRKSGTERIRLGRSLFGYALGIDKWLLGIPMQFLLLDLGHANLDFDPRDEILRVYAYLGEEITPVKKWLAACLWGNLNFNKQGCLLYHKELVQNAKKNNINHREWIDSKLTAE